MARPADPNRRNAILKAARELFLERGFVQARVTDIAERAGMAPGTFYLYFASKEAIVMALGEEFYAQLSAEVLPVIAASPPNAMIADAVRTTLACSSAHRDLLKLKHLDVGLNTLVPLPARAAFRDALAQQLGTLMERGVLHTYEPAILAELILGLVERAADVCLLYEAGDLAAYEVNLVALLSNALLIR